jgi:hypothetical protein
MMDLYEVILVVIDLLIEPERPFGRIDLFHITSLPAMATVDVVPVTTATIGQPLP